MKLKVLFISKSLKKNTEIGCQAPYINIIEVPIITSAVFLPSPLYEK